MSVTSLKRSGIKTGQKYSKIMAGNLKNAWIDNTWTLFTRSSSVFSASSNTSRLIHFNFKGEGLQQNFTAGSGGGIAGVTNYGDGSFTNSSTIGYSNNLGAFNGWFIGGGNYTSSTLAYKQDALGGWTQITGYSNYTGSGGIGTGGFTSQRVPVWMIPVTTGSVVQGFVSTTTLPNTSWTLNTVGTFAGSTSGSVNKVALTNDTVVYIFHSAYPATGANMVIKYAAVTPSTGAISTTWNTGSLNIGATGPILGLETVGGVFVLTTTTGDRYSSTNGATWTQRVAGTAGTSNMGLQITSGETGYMIGFSYVSTTNYGVSYSTDGITFTSMNTFQSTTYGDFAAIGVGKGIRFAHTNGGTVWFKNP